MGRKSAAAATPAALAELDAEIRVIEGIRDQAVEDRYAASALKASAQLVELRARRRRVEAEERQARARTPLERVAILRELAVADGSWVAAARLAEEEERLREEERIRKEAAREAREAGQSDAEIVDELVAAIRALPLVLQERVRRALDHPVLPAARRVVDEEEDEDGG